ncbi:hypothetical protein B2G71_21240 [Novosphingobium sp. PC22D]|uniref:hypothetical protein n=1 Tax=Novosphingobium sp. PC22D TaxID=1962403 RepID=UPI000BF1C9FA|nr:hypothetical protein [Novosphingobium sp. PC22D]PEQ10608.1 hypothetical protein B2G71_21240 [Novosphingobium sp. PC22D]
MTSLPRPRPLALTCAFAALLLGMAYMALAGAPLRYFAVNGGAFAIGLLLLPAIDRAGVNDDVPSGALPLVLAVGLLASALFAQPVGGASRWLLIGPLAVQPSLVVLPAMLVAHAKRPGRLGDGAMILAALAVALQPDRAMAAALVAGLAVLRLSNGAARRRLPFAASLAAFAVTMLRPDTQPAMPWVDQILYTAFDVGLPAGLAVLGGSALLLAPALPALLTDHPGHTPLRVFGAVWLALIAAAALGNYPTPMVGYSGSAVLGYVLALAVLPRQRAGTRDRARPPGTPSRHDEGLACVPLAA